MAPTNDKQVKRHKETAGRNETPALRKEHGTTSEIIPRIIIMKKQTKMESV